MFGIFLFGILQLEVRTAGAYPKVAHLLAGFSYSLYVLHFPLLLFLRAWLAPSHRWQPDALHLFYGLIVGVATLLFAWIVAAFTEKKTHVVRDWMDTLIPRSAKTSFGRRITYALRVNKKPQNA